MQAQQAEITQPDSHLKENVIIDISQGKTASLPPAKCFTWSGVGLSVKIKEGKAIKPKELLQEMYGQVNAGEVVAIMGGSGAGKSTLLNTLAGRIADTTTLTGDILVDGHPRNMANWRIQCAYVEQDDIMYRNLTVFETLRYSALLRLPSSVSPAEKLERVNHVIATLGLNGCRDTIIGDTVNRGISGGERKRVSIGIELVTNPQILFLDEPTSGLDAFNALNLITTLKKLAVEQNKIILMTIHQPRTDILNLLDKVLLLSMGKCVWFGSCSAALTHFSDIGYKIPENTNPSDFFLDITTLDQRTAELKQQTTMRIEKFVAAYRAIRKECPRMDAIPESIKMKTQWPSMWLGEFSVLLQRNMKNTLRDKAAIGATIGQSVFLFFLIGFIFFKLENSIAGVQSRVGLLFFLCINQTFGVVMPQINVFPQEREIMKRERAAGSYRATSAYLAKFVSSQPLSLAASLILSTPIYWMTGLQPIASKYFTYACILLVQTFTANSLGLCISAAVPTAQVGQIIAPLILVIFLIFGGLFVNLEKVPEVFRWIQWLSFVSYSNKALVQNEFDENVKFTCSAGQACYSNGLQVVSAFGLGTPSLWICVIINLSLAMTFLIIGYFQFNRTSRPLMKLRSEPVLAPLPEVVVDAPEHVE